MPESGIVLVDKPTGWTSHDVVAKLRKILGTKKIGHAGTLDPLATGLLVLGVEAGTKLLTFLVGADKTYLATVRLGASTTTDDSESEPIFQADPQRLRDISPEEITAALKAFSGKIQQRPSSVSAIKVQGKRAYDLVRQGEVVNLKPREVEIKSLHVIGEPVFNEGFIDLELEISCSSGTYIRAIARDLGAALGVGGHLTLLRRLRVGGFDVEAASSIEDQMEINLIPLGEAAQGLFPRVLLSPEQVRDVLHGKRLSGFDLVGTVGAYSEQGKLVAVMQGTGMDLKSTVVFQGEING